LKPEKDGGKSVLAALWERKTNRNISPEKLPPQMLSNLLWAAFGVNRENGGRTAASASNSQEIDIYVALAEATYLYNPIRHMLAPVAEGDLRRYAIGRGQAPAGADAPVRLIYVADIDRLANTKGFMEPGLRDPEVQRSYYYIDIGLMAANAYLFAAAAGLAAWFHNCDKAALTAKLDLSKDQRVLFGQTFGYPIKKGRCGFP